MALLNTPTRYGALMKALHWSIAALFAFQLASSQVMTRLAEGQAALGVGQDGWYNWHKTLGLMALLLAVGRLSVRQAGLPAWAPQLSERERGAIHHIERALYLAMFVMPVSGFVFVMAGGYGVEFAGTWTLPDPIGRAETLARAAQLVHAAGGIVLVLALAAHLGIVLRHAVMLRDGLLGRMLPGRR